MCATTPTATPTPRHRLRQYRVRRAASTSSSSDSDDANDAVKPPSTRTTGRQVGRQHAEVVVEEVDGGEVASAEVKDDTDMHGPDTDFPAGGAGIRALSIAEPVGRVGEANESTRAPPTGGDAIRAAAKHATEDAETVPNALTPLHILATPSRGRGIYSPGPICSGRQLYNEGPYAAALSTAHLGTHCSGCFGSLRKVLRCTGCGVVCYCGVGCQRGDWGVHRWECAAWRAVKGRVPTTAVRVLCRLLWKRARDRAGYEKIDALVSNREHYTQDKIETFAQMAMLIRSIVGEEVCLDAGGMVRVLCMFSCNSISICDEELVNIGVGIYPTLSLINHSCVPNTALIFSGSTATLRSIREIRPGEEICQSYTEVADPESVRRRGLREAYFFECCCEGCVGEGVKTADPRTSYICPLPRCPGVLFPISQPHNDHSIRPDSDDDIESEDPTTYHCTTHGPLLAPHLSTFLTNLTHARKQFYTPGSDLPASAPRPPIPHLESSLKLWSTLAPPTHHLRIALHRALQAAHLSTGNLRAALVHAEMLAGAYAEIYNPRGGTYHPAVSVQRYLAFTLRFTIAVEEDGRGNGLNEDEEGLRGLARDGREVVRLLGVSHGEASALWREARGRGEEVEVRLRGRGF